MRYFLLKFTRTAIIAFDFKEALSFDGETGPYLQYATVRAGNILRKMSETDEDFSVQGLPGYLAERNRRCISMKADDIWELIYTISRLDEIAAQTISDARAGDTGKVCVYSRAAVQPVLSPVQDHCGEPTRRVALFYLSMRGDVTDNSGPSREKTASRVG